MDEISALLSLQDGVISRRQALAAGLPPHSIARLVRRREWAQVHPGVYVDHTGRLSWRQRAWAAVLACWPAALDGRSSLRAHQGPGRRGRDDDAIAVMVAHARRVREPEGVQVRRSRRFDQQVRWNLSPPRMAFNDTVLEIADIGILADVEGGTCSVLEHRYLTAVERPHGLPRGRRQDRVVRSNRPMIRDVVYRGPRQSWTQVVELDGRLDHDSATARDRDMERDLDAALEADHTVRIGYGQVFDRPCLTAGKIGRLLRRRGWPGQSIACPKCPG